MPNFDIDEPPLPSDSSDASDDDSVASSYESSNAVSPSFVESKATTTTLRSELHTEVLTDVYVIISDADDYSVPTQPPASPVTTSSSPMQDVIIYLSPGTYANVLSVSRLNTNLYISAKKI